MKRLVRLVRLVRLAFTAAATVAMAVTACSGPPAPAGGHKQKAGPPTYYLALGDSLSQGVQPDAAGASAPTSQGYPDQVYAVLRRSHPTLRLVKLGCPGETTSTMIKGGICRYPGGSQLAAAISLLRSHRGHVLLVTIDIGADDLEDCGSRPGLVNVASCIGLDVPETTANLTTIMARLRAAAGTGPRTVGMNYYLPELAEWRDGLVGRAVAWLSERLAVGYNDMLTRAYSQFGFRVADVFGAFSTTDFTGQMTLPGIGTVPRNVALVCRWTWECAPAPRGPNQHANEVGYGVIARTVLHAAGF
jgi:lysophospholipase L1-like esterase